MVANDIKIILKMNNKSEMSLEKTYYNNIISLLSFTKTKISQAVIKTHMTWSALNFSCKCKKLVFHVSVRKLLIEKLFFLVIIRNLFLFKKFEFRFLRQVQNFFCLENCLFLCKYKRFFEEWKIDFLRLVWNIYLFEKKNFCWGGG